MHGCLMFTNWPLVTPYGDLKWINIVLWSGVFIYTTESLSEPDL